MEEIDLVYQLALDKLKGKFDSLYLEFSKVGLNNPIEHIKYRIKKLNSIEDKLKKKDLAVTLENIHRLNDVVGVRLVCSFLDDMYQIIDIIEKDQEIKILNRKDYVSHPKKSGYMSYHLIVDIPVTLLSGIVFVKAEIQIRTIAMDMWASLEHKIWYKKGIELPMEMMQEIYKTSEICQLVDNNLNVLSKQANFVEKSGAGFDYSWMRNLQYEFMYLKYESALKVVLNKISTIYHEYELSEEINPIEHIKSRLKTPDRIMAKLGKMATNFSVEEIEKYVNDIAGIRIVCSFRSDLDEIVSLIKKDESLEVIKEKDYVNHPKESGYSSYHLLVRVPLYLQEGLTYAKVEIQVRTIAMDMWASLEHKLCYQKATSDDLKQELKNLSSVIRVIDENMEKTIQQSRDLVIEKKRCRKKNFVKKDKVNI